MNIYRLANNGSEQNFSRADMQALKDLDMIEFDRIESYDSVVVHWYRKAQA